MNGEYESVFLVFKISVDSIRAPLRLKVGFIVKESVGYRRIFPIDFGPVTLEPDLKLERLTGNIEISRTPQGLLVQSKLEGTILSECARCLKQISMPLKAKFTELFALSERHTSESGLILPEDGDIDLGPIARECIILEIPINPTCKPDCKGLCPVCGENLNEVDCGHKNEDIDSRLATLKNFL